MIFTTDLDRTLVFSARRLLDRNMVIPVERRQEISVGFLRPCALRLIELLQKKTIFFANTMRNEDQAYRISFIKGSSYLSVLGGMRLYRKGTLDREWEMRAKQILSDLPFNVADLIPKVKQGLQGIEKISVQTENLAVFILKEEDFCEQSYQQLKEALKKEGWGLRRQEKKLYLFPWAIHKGAVVKRVQELEGESNVIGFGDSYFDLAMLKECEQAYSLKGSELSRLNCGFPIQFSKEEAEIGSEENLYTIFLETQEK